MSKPTTDEHGYITYLAGVNSDGPDYTVSEVAKLFFGMSSHWVRWLGRKGYIQGQQERKRGDQRIFKLVGVERLCNTLYLAEAISLPAYTRAINMVRLQAEIHGMFEVPYTYEDVEYSLSLNDLVEMLAKPGDPNDYKRKKFWARARLVQLGGVKRRWDENWAMETWRFPEEGLDERLYALGLPVKAEHKEEGDTHEHASWEEVKESRDTQPE